MCIPVIVSRLRRSMKSWGRGSEPTFLTMWLIPFASSTEVSAFLVCQVFCFVFPFLAQLFYIYIFHNWNKNCHDISESFLPSSSILVYIYVICLEEISCSLFHRTLILLLHTSVPIRKHNPTCVSPPPYGRISNSCQLQRTGISEWRGRVPGGRSFSQTRICRHHQRTRVAKIPGASLSEALGLTLPCSPSLCLHTGSSDPVLIHHDVLYVR